MSIYYDLYLKNENSKIHLEEFSGEDAVDLWENNVFSMDLNSSGAADMLFVLQVIKELLDTRANSYREWSRKYSMLSAIIQSANHPGELLSELNEMDSTLCFCKEELKRTKALYKKLAYIAKVEQFNPDYIVYFVSSS